MTLSERSPVAPSIATQTHSQENPTVVTPTPTAELANSRVNAVARRIWAEALAQPEFADVGVIWAYSASSASDHRNGRCCDFMVTYTKRGLTAAQRVALGDKIRAYFVRHAARLHVQGIIWNHKVTGFPIGGGTSNPDVTYRGPSGQARPYYGGDQHTDHVHVQVSGAPVKSWLSAPTPVVKPDTTKEPVVPKPPQFVIALDAPGAGNWQGIAQNISSGEWFIAHSQKREDGAEDTHFYRFDKTGAYQDKMTLVKGGHVLGFGVSDTNVIWTTYNDASGNDVVTVQYEAGVKKSKADCTPMHVFTDGNAQISFSPSRDWCAVLERTSDYDTVRRYAKSDILDNKDNPRGLPVKMKRSPGRTIQGFAPVNANLYVLTGMTLGEAAIEVWSFDTGEKVATHKLGGGAVLDGVVSDKIEPEGCDGRLFGMKVGTDTARRLHVFKHSF